MIRSGLACLGAGVHETATKRDTAVSKSVTREILSPPCSWQHLHVSLSLLQSSRSFSLMGWHRGAVEQSVPTCTRGLWAGAKSANSRCFGPMRSGHVWYSSLSDKPVRKLVNDARAGGQSDCTLGGRARNQSFPLSPEEWEKRSDFVTRTETNARATEMRAKEEAMDPAWTVRQTV